MERELFEMHLWLAVDGARHVADRMVTPALPAETRMRVLLNQSFDGNPLVGDERTFPSEPHPDGELSVAEASALLWREGGVPEWIDAAVVASDRGRALVELRCCGRFTATADLLYHAQKGLPPFAVKSPYLPPSWRNVECDGRFGLPPS